MKAEVSQRLEPPRLSADDLKPGMYRRYQGSTHVGWLLCVEGGVYVAVYVNDAPPMALTLNELRGDILIPENVEITFKP